MSETRPMTTVRRAAIYERQHPVTPTLRQLRQLIRMAEREEARLVGELTTGLGGSGNRTTRPVERPARPALRGSHATHRMVECPGVGVCKDHRRRPRFHREPR